VFGVLAMLVEGGAWAAPAMVWSQKEVSGINVYFSPDSQRTMQITSTGVNVAPNLFRGAKSTWLTWVDKSNTIKNQLKYARVSESGRLVEEGSVPTVHGRIYAPAISLTPDQRRVWLVWVEYNGQQENLYASFMDSGSEQTSSWRRPMQVTPDDEYSASLPVIETALFDRARVSWMRSSLTSSGAASIDLMAQDWTPVAEQLRHNPMVRQDAAHRTPSLKSVYNADIYAKRLKRGQALSADEQKWKNMVRNKNVLSGAVHSGGGASKRLANEIPK